MAVPIVIGGIAGAEVAYLAASGMTSALMLYCAANATPQQKQRALQAFVDHTKTVFDSNAYKKGVFDALEIVARLGNELFRQLQSTHVTAKLPEIRDALDKFRAPSPPGSPSPGLLPALFVSAVCG